MFSRYASAITTSTLMTFSLFYVMQALIAMQPGATPDTGIRHPIDWVMLDPIEEPPKTREYEIDREQLIDNLLPPDTPFDYGSNDAVGVPIPAPQVLEGPIATSYAPSDSPLVDLINVQPVYPARALQSEIEGYVIVEFDVNASGRPENIRILESSHSVFNRAAVQAAQRFKFKARIVDGTPVATRSIRKMFRFDLEDD